MIGVIQFRPLKAVLKRDTEMFGKQDPYVKIKVGQQEYIGKVHKDAGKFPVWSDSFSISLSLDDNIMFIEVWDKNNVKSDTLICQGTLPISNLKTPVQKNGETLLSYKGKDAGTFYYSTQFCQNGNSSSQQFQQAQMPYGFQTQPQQAMYPQQFSNPMMAQNYGVQNANPFQQQQQPMMFPQQQQQQFQQAYNMSGANANLQQNPYNPYQQGQQQIGFPLAYPQPNQFNQGMQQFVQQYQQNQPQPQVVQNQPNFQQSMPQLQPNFQTQMNQPQPNQPNLMNQGMQQFVQQQILNNQQQFQPTAPRMGWVFQPQQNFQRSQALSVAEQIFNQVDLDRNGYLDDSEFYNAICMIFNKLGSQPPSKDLVFAVKNEYEQKSQGKIYLPVFKLICDDLMGNEDPSKKKQSQ